MFIPKKNRILVYSYLFKEGVLVVKKDYYAPSHSEELNIPNLEVCCLMRTMKSKGFVTETFNWQYYYYILTNDGIEYLRQYLALPAEIVPATLKKSAGAASGEKPEKKAVAGGDFNPEFQKGGKEEYRS
eukprot:gene29302-35374_t